MIQSASKVATAHGQLLEVCYSGGKDSDVILELTKMAGVPYRAIYKNTSIDPSGTIKHAKEMGVEIMQPKKRFFELVAENGFPSRFMRFCCRYLKEYKILDYAILGIRSEESKLRAKRYKEPELCHVYNKKEKVRQYLPILNWSEEDITEFAVARKIVFHPLYYDERGNFHPERRLGCLCCPLQSYKERLKSFKENPNMVKLYCKYGGEWFKNHKQTKTAQRLKDIYEMFTFSVFCKNMQEFNKKFGETLFDDGIDCKRFLENYFNIKF